MLCRPSPAGTARWLSIAAVLGLCLQPLPAQQSSAAKVVSLTGQVSVLRDNYPWALHAGDAVRPGQIIVTGADGAAVFEILSDNSRFEVFPNSRVIFRETPANWTDVLDVLIGRVKVYIQKLGGQPNFNRVRTPTAVISVRGTVFDVVVEDEQATVVSVEEGQVEVKHSEKPGPARILNPGEWLRIVKNQPIAKTVDKGGLVQGTLRAAAQALYEVLYRTSRAPGGSGGPTGAPPAGTTPPPAGDRDKNDPPPPLPPPPQ